ncbi:TPA: ATP-binding protein [Enterococcus faecalis]|uniref:ATP-binding protein n=1 Tax=Enterococcus faecalis TaxID=1351 RepID=UPI000CF28200|nr:ATP-binding protein [Enterococcus faecalis]EHR4813385.1 ATP-binding protein [Enterococcus faecalis]PQE72049.1 hypothetical protein CUT01_04385 [Enterococcus faecalis]PQF05422.1 hypothetical protein CUT03_07390 [Enterococcus faecalis]RXV92916.1 hypothetical protein CYQ23_07585 [Enterococcus faecalis]HED9419395.1 ATP-binding protein [Enterococcus faecalis]
MEKTLNAREKNKKARFKVDSRLITQILGSEIIESHSIAFAEQIKNAKDAGATEVIIDFSNMENDEITIEDNGNGMSEIDVEEDWFLLGKSKKDGEISFSGGKGIGRLSLFKIGSKFQVKTSNGKSTTTFKISAEELTHENADSFEADLYTEIKSTPIGTKITINELDSEISLEEIEVELNNLLSEDNQLSLQIVYPLSFKPTTFLTKEDIIDIVPFSAKIDIDFDNFNKVEDIKYQFSASLKNEIVYENDSFLPRFKKVLNGVIAKQGDILNIGKIHFELTNFFFENNQEDYLPKSIDGKSIREYFLKVHQGINIYRNGFKIYGHGSEDWLKLAENRLSKPGENIDNKLSYGVIILDDGKSEQLKEKSNREGFIRNGSSKLFKELISIIVKQFGQDRQKATKNIKEKISQLKAEDERIKQEESEKKKAEEQQNQLNTSIDTKDDKGLEGNELENKTNKSDEKKKDSDNEKNILKFYNKSIEQGDMLFLKHPDLVNNEFINDVILSCSGGLVTDKDMVTTDNVPGDYTIDYICWGRSEKFNLKICKRKVIIPKKADEFFKNSNQFNGEIDLSNINTLVLQLNGLKYSDKYLLYIISFRAIIESLVKDYISKRSDLSLRGSLQENVEITIDDLLRVIDTNKKDPFQSEKLLIHNKFKGRAALKNFLSSLKIKFNSKNYDQFLHSLTHNPTIIDKSLALEVANEMILPLYVLINSLDEKGIL